MSSVMALRTHVQRFGRFLSAMVMTNIGAFIAWGLITALFIGPGWLPNEKLAVLVGPMLKALLPVLIGYTGGKAVGGARGGVIGAVATFGVMVGAGGQENLASGTPMLLGGMICGPLGGYLVKKADSFLHGKIKAGFEMLVNNFVDGIIGLILACLGLIVIGPTVNAISGALGRGVAALVNAGLLPVASILIEPAKILFLNNAINHGVFTPLGAEQSAEIGKSIFFMLESNPGPGLGILLAYLIFAKGTAKESAPGAILIHFIGGIHEIYFPYVLMNPLMVLAVIAGGMSGVFVFSILGAGLVGPPAPGSIMMYIAMTPKGGFFPVMSGVAISTAVSFVVASIFVKKSSSTDDELEAATQTVQDIKSRGKISKIAFACDAGMGSSAAGASILQKKIKAAGLNVKVVHCSVDEIDKEASLVVCHKNLAERVRISRPDVQVFGVSNILAAPEYDQIISQLKG